MESVYFEFILGLIMNNQKFFERLLEEGLGVEWLDTTNTPGETEIPVIAILEDIPTGVAYYLGKDGDKYGIYTDDPGFVQSLTSEITINHFISEIITKAFEESELKITCPDCNGTGETTDVDPAHCPGGIGICRRCNGEKKISPN
jgi:hypothetical protein